MHERALNSGNLMEFRFVRFDCVFPAIGDDL